MSYSSSYMVTNTLSRLQAQKIGIVGSLLLRPRQLRQKVAVKASSEAKATRNTSIH